MSPLKANSTNSVLLPILNKKEKLNKYFSLEHRVYAQKTKIDEVIVRISKNFKIPQNPHISETGDLIAEVPKLFFVIDHFHNFAGSGESPAFQFLP